MAQNFQYNPALGTLALADSLDFEVLLLVWLRNTAVKTNCKSLKLAVAWISCCLQSVIMGHGSFFYSVNLAWKLVKTG